jgi:hypothetical protein
MEGKGRSLAIANRMVFMNSRAILLRALHKAWIIGRSALYLSFGATFFNFNVCEILDVFY